MSLINYTILLTFPIGFISGLFVAPWTCLIILIMLWNFRANINLANFSVSKLEYTLIAYSFASSIWSINSQTSILIAMQFTTLILIVNFILKQNLQLNQQKIILGIYSSLVIFYIEKFSGGAITLFVRKITSHDNGFNLSFLDRGCALFSVVIWPVLYMTIKNNRKHLSIFLYFITLITLLLSDSTASLLGFVMASITFLIIFLSKMKLRYLIKIAIIFSLVAMPIISKIENPRYIAQEYGNKIPISYIHRLLIWNFVADKALEKPLIGQGIGTSKFTKITNEDKLFYNNQILHPLPLHPHNNILQIFLELGIVGLSIFGLFIWQTLSKIDSNKNILLSSISYATFSNYFIIGMVSFGVWQSWWLLSGILAIILIKSQHSRFISK